MVVHSCHETRVSHYRVGFPLIDGFSLMSYSSAIEPLRVANEFSKRTLYDIRHIRSASDPQRADPAQRYGVSHPNIVKAIGAMEKHPMEEKLTRSALAKLVHISPRHLGRLFRD